MNNNNLWTKQVAVCMSKSLIQLNHSKALTDSGIKQISESKNHSLNRFLQNLI